MSEETKKEVQGTDPVKEEIKVTATAKAKTAKQKTKALIAKEQKAENPKPETKASTTDADPESGKATKSEADFMDHYRKVYPKEPCFHVTSDKQVFLSRDLPLAKRHQKTVDEKKEVETIER